MKRLWNGLFVSAVILQVPLVSCAAWGIYDPVTDQNVSKSAGAKTCSGIADVAGAVKVKLLSPSGVPQDNGNGTADNSTWHWWTAVLAAPYNRSVDTDTPTSRPRHTLQLTDGLGNIKHQTKPKIVP